MKKAYKLQNIHCANCASKIEDEINKLPEVESASIAFMTQRLVLEGESHEQLLPKIEKIIKKIERDGGIIYG